MRRVRLNEPHPSPLTPSWYRDPVGHYEGDTLVIDTVGVKTKSQNRIARRTSCAPWQSSGRSFPPALRHRHFDSERIMLGLAFADRHTSTPGVTPPVTRLSYL